MTSRQSTANLAVMGGFGSIWGDQLFRLDCLRQAAPIRWEDAIERLMGSTATTRKGKL